MTAYSKICPKCQAPCDFAATSCKKCKLVFGAQPAEEDAPPPKKEPILLRPAVRFTAFGVLALIMLGIIVGAIQYQLREQHTLEVQRRDVEAHRRVSAGKD